VIAALAVILVVLIFVLAVNYRSLRRSMATVRESWITALVHRHGSATVGDIAFVRPWMTFDYLDKLFNLPPEYLRSTLGVSDARYPRFTVSSWAKGAKIDSATAMTELQDALKNYLMQNGSSTIN
jgi:hypothetical protein